jgi:hypothetical protein
MVATVFFIFLTVTSCLGYSWNRATYFYSGHLPTRQLWEADLIFNGNYSQFCTQLKTTFVSATDIMNHFTSVKDPARGGYFYQDWYYVGPRYCGNDRHIYGAPIGGSTSTHNSVWQYTGGCDCCVVIEGWTFERRGFITCE